MEVKKFSEYKSVNQKPDVILDFPVLRQVFNYDCDASALQQLL